MLEQNLVQERCQSSDPGTAGRNEWVGGHTEFPLSECQVLFARGLTRPSVNRITLYGRSVCLASGRHGDGTRDPAKGCNFRNDSAHEKRPGQAGAFKSAAKALRALDYLLLVAGAEDMAFLA